MEINLALETNLGTFSHNYLELPELSRPRSYQQTHFLGMGMTVPHDGISKMVVYKAVMNLPRAPTPDT